MGDTKSLMESEFRDRHIRWTCNARITDVSDGHIRFMEVDEDGKERKQHEKPLSPQERIQKQLDSNFRIMEQIRARVDAIVEDPVTAAALKPY